jgi:hypothetical protein
VSQARLPGFADPFKIDVEAGAIVADGQGGPSGKRAKRKEQGGVKGRLINARPASGNDFHR